MVFCPECGSKNPENANYCQECGENLKTMFTKQNDLIKRFADNHLEIKYSKKELKNLRNSLDKNGAFHTERELKLLVQNEIILQSIEKFAAEHFETGYNQNELTTLRKALEKNGIYRSERILNSLIINKISLQKGIIRKKGEMKLREEWDKFISSGNYIYLKNFVKKYGYNYQSYTKDTTNFNYDRKFDDLRKLLAIKGSNLSSLELLNLIKMEIKLRKYEDFKSKILYNQPNDLEGYIKSLVDAFGENCYQYKDLFLIFLSEKGVSFDKPVLNTLIKSAFEQKKLEIFEKGLLDSDNFNRYIHNLDSLTGYEFEEFLRTLFDKMGFTAETTKLSGDQGADLIIKKFGKITAVQAKRYTDKVSNKAVQEVTASMAYYSADNGMVVTTSEFTPSAIELANSNNIELIDRQKLEELINKYY
jgi:hypothetical protein